MKNTLIIESGSTKTDWVVITSEGNYQFATQGINPSSNKNIFDLRSEQADILDYAKSIEEIHYFGAGVIDDRTRSIVKDWLLQYFDRVQNIQIESDMLGAALATAGDHKGIISILGTGSNSCLYNGSEIIDNIPSLGFALSNEGGGSHIGGQLLKAIALLAFLQALTALLQPCNALTLSPIKVLSLKIEIIKQKVTFFQFLFLKN